MTLLMNLQRNRQGLLPAASQCCPVQSGYVALPSQGKATKVKKRVHFSKLVTVIKSEYSLSAEERRETWWQREDYCGFKWEIALQLRAPRQRLLVGTDNAVPKAEQIASDIKEESDVEDLLQSLTFDTALLQWCRSSYRGLESFSSCLAKKRSRMRTSNLTKIVVLSFKLDSDELRRVSESHSRCHRIMARMLGAGDAMVVSDSEHVPVRRPSLSEINASSPLRQK